MPGAGHWPGFPLVQAAITAAQDQQGCGRPRRPQDEEALAEGNVAFGDAVVQALYRREAHAPGSCTQADSGGVADWVIRLSSPARRVLALAGMDLNLTGKTVVVTGASRRIGLAFTRGFLAEGAHVIAGALKMSPPGRW
jgi:hypothetical protein